MEITPEESWHETVVLPVGLAEERAGATVRAVILRKMTGHEEALLADAKLRGNAGKLISALLGSCVKMAGDVGTPGSGLDFARRLTSADRNYLMLELRRLTFGDEMEAIYRCPRCQAVNSVMEDLSTIESKRLGDAEDPRPIVVKLRDGYRDPDGQWHHDLTFRLPSGEDEEAAGARRDANPARQRDTILARCLTEVGTLVPHRVEALGVRILAELSMGDRQLIHRTLDEHALGPNLSRHMECQSCGTPFKATLDMSNFFPLE